MLLRVFQGNVIEFTAEFKRGKTAVVSDDAPVLVVRKDDEATTESINFLWNEDRDRWIAEWYASESGLFHVRAHVAEGSPWASSDEDAVMVMPSRVVT